MVRVANPVEGLPDAHCLPATAVCGVVSKDGLILLTRHCERSEAMTSLIRASLSAHPPRRVKTILAGVVEADDIAGWIHQSCFPP